MLSDDQIIKYQTLYKSRYGRDISREQALEQGLRLIRLVELIYRPMTKEEYQRLQDRRRETNNMHKTY